MRARRRLLIGLLWIAVLVGLSGGQPAASAPPRVRHVLFVGNVWDGTVTLVNARTLRVIGTLNVTPDGKTPHDPIQALLYPLLVARNGPDFVQGLAVSPTGRTLFVSRGYLGDVAAF